MTLKSSILFMTKMVLAAIWMLVGFSAAGAQSILKEHDTYQPIEITAERLEVRQKEGQASFKGDVRVIQGQMTFTSDSITVFYDTESGLENPSITRLDAIGKVALTSDTEAITGEWGIYDVNARLVTLGGNVTFKRGESTLKGDRLEMNLVTGLTKLDGLDSEQNGRVEGRFKVPTSNPDN